MMIMIKISKVPQFSGKMAPSKWIAEMFHSFPHLDFDFQNTTLIFTPTDKPYQQVGVPIIYYPQLSRIFRAFVVKC